MDGPRFVPTSQWVEIIKSGRREWPMDALPGSVPPGGVP